MLFTVAGAFFGCGACAGDEGRSSGRAEHGGSDDKDVGEVHDCVVREREFKG